MIFFLFSCRSIERTPIDILYLSANLPTCSAYAAIRFEKIMHIEEKRVSWNLQRQLGSHCDNN